VTNDSQKHQRRLFANKLLIAYGADEKKCALTLADDYVEGRGTIDALWREIREDAQ